MDALNLVAESATRIADVLSGGDSEIPIPPALDAVASQVSAVLSSDAVPRIPYVDFSDKAFARALVATVLPPLLWNIIGPFEYYTRILSKVSFKPIIGVYLSGFFIASLSVYRSALFVAAINSQLKLEEMNTTLVHVAAGFVMMWGLAMFLGAYYRLRITGTYLGDYFGILRDERITAFPFNISNNPMYDGSSLNHLAEALLQRSPAGIFLALWLFTCYRIGCIIEEPFTAKMYEERDKRRLFPKSKTT
eukprot:GFKZ01012411.1.p1 GENE.GFKZ01012411.1~~GFKZ01012411.1.p1  ORF type:complete len:249 (-),score=21.66 GFKZ01012411.1:170-916(-)